jgi:hypothetical protein
VRRIAIAAAALFLLRADMYQDASNAAQPAASDNLGKAAGGYFAPAYGSCTWDATHDVGACVNQALTAAAAVGGTVSLPPGTYGLSTRIVWPTAAPVRLVCPGGSSATPATMLKWIGAAAGRMAEVRTGTGSVKGAAITGCGFNGNGGLAADGLYLASVYNGHFDDLTFTGGFSGGNVVNLTVDSVTGAGSQNNTFDNLYIDNGTNFGAGYPYSSNQLRLGAFIDGTGVHGNAAFNRGNNIFIGGSGGTGILCVGCDNNYLSGRVFNSGTSVDLTVAVSGANMFPASGNVLSPMQYTGAAVARGKTTFPACASYSTCTYNNNIVIDSTNATPQPTVETGADLSWGSNSGYRSNLSLIGKRLVQPGLVAAHDYAIWGGCKQNAALYGTQATTYLCNSENSPYVAFDSVGGDRFQIDSSGSAGAQSLRFQRMAGTGSFVFQGAPVVVPVVAVASLPTCDATRKHGVMSVSDQNGAPTYRGALTGGGAIAVLAYCNGTSWEAH